MSSPRTPTDRLGRGDIEAAITAHNSARGHTVLLPPDAVRLLTAMFSEDDVCRRSVRSLAAEGFDARTVRHLLRALLDTGFLSKGSARRGVLTAVPCRWTATRRPVSRPTRAPGTARHRGALGRAALDVLGALLWAFHNTRSGCCFPSYERIAEKAGCARSTVAETIKALEFAGC